MSYVSSRRSSTANTLGAGQWYTLSPYALFGATLRNLADTRYTDPGFAGIDYPQLGRTFMPQAIQEF